MSAAEARALLERHGLAAHRSRGQNFLHDPQLAAKLVRLAEVAADEAVVEVGTGLGILTRALAARAARVVTVEVDAGLVRALRAEGGLPANVELLHADALSLDWAALLPDPDEPARIVANLPYSVAAPLVRRFLDLAPRLRGWSVMVQKEVAVRLAAAPGGRDYGSLSVLHQLLARVEASLDLHPRCFYPVPRVTSTFLRAQPRRDGSVQTGELSAVEAIVRGGFSHRRKTLVNALQQSRGLAAEEIAAALASAGVAPRVRAQDVTPDQWLALARRLSGPGGQARFPQ